MSAYNNTWLLAVFRGKPVVARIEIFATTKKEKKKKKKRKTKLYK